MGKKIAHTRRRHNGDPVWRKKRSLLRGSGQLGRANRAQVCDDAARFRTGGVQFTSPQTGSLSLPCQRRLHELQGSTMPWRRFLLCSCELRSPGSPEPKVSYHGVEREGNRRFPARSRIFDQHRMTVVVTTFGCPWTFTYPPQDAVVWPSRVRHLPSQIFAQSETLCYIF